MQNLAEKLQQVHSIKESTSPNYFSEQQKLAKLKDVLLSAREELAEPTRTEAWAGIQKALLYFAQTYHILSVLFGLATALLAVFILSGFSFDWAKISVLEGIIRGALAVFALALLIFILIMIEQGKIFFAKSYFSKLAKKTSPSGNEAIGLITLALISILFSTIGGALITYQTTDQSQALQINLKQQTESIERRYNQRIDQNEQKLKQLSELSLNQAQRRWGLTPSEQSDLRFAQQEVIRLEQAKKQDLDQLTQNFKHHLAQDQNYTWQAVIVSLGLVLLFELITIFAYYFKYNYLATVEREAMALGVIDNQWFKPATPAVAPSLDNLKENLNLLPNKQDLLGQNFGLPIYKESSNHQPSKPIGFAYGESKPVNETLNSFKNDTFGTKIQEKIIVKQPPQKEKYDADTLLSKHTDIVQEIYTIHPNKIKYVDIQRKTGKDLKTVRKVYQTMLVKGYLRD